MPRPIVVCLSNTDWGFLRYRKQHLMERLSRYADVVYVNPPRALKSQDWALYRRTRTLSRSLRVHEPFVMPGMRRWPISRWLTYRWLAARLSVWCAHRQVVLWLYSPHGLPFIDLLRPDRVVYDIADLHATPSGKTLRDEGERGEIDLLARLEKELLARADVALCVSEPLVERVRDRSRRVVLVPNGCDWNRYRDDPSALEFKSFSTLDSRTPLRVGYIGTLAPRVDAELLAAVARRRPEWTIELVGPTLPFFDVKPLASMRNVVMTGEIPFEQVPAALATFDVCVLPLREIDFAYYCSPIQVFDYLAAGKPVVSPPVGQLEEWGGLVHIARGADEFIAAIERASHERTVDHVLRRRAFAARNSWDTRVSQIAGVLSSLGVPLDHALADRRGSASASEATAAFSNQDSAA